MKHLLIILTIAVMTTSVQAVSERLLDAIEKVESGGRNIIGDGGDAVGYYQIHSEVVRDINRIYKTNYKCSDRTNRDKSRNICRLYIAHYGKGLSTECQARIWNGGPLGYRKMATVKYWKKIERAMR